MTVDTFRKTHHATDSLFVARRSSRALTGEPIPDAVLFGSFEAARWAPSGGNAQPWRFIYAKKESTHWHKLHALLNEKNREWAQHASALVLVLSRKTRDTPEGIRPLRSHSFDTGAAWSNFAHQASLLGWSTRAIGGFHYDDTRTALEIPDHYEIEVFIAIGKAKTPTISADGDANGASAGAEQPSDRLPVSSLVSDGRFTFS